MNGGGIKKPVTQKEVGLPADLQAVLSRTQDFRAQKNSPEGGFAPKGDSGSVEFRGRPGVGVRKIADVEDQIFENLVGRLNTSVRQFGVEF